MAVGRGWEGTGSYPSKKTKQVTQIKSTYHVDSTVQSAVYSIATDDGVTFRSDLNPSKSIVWNKVKLFSGFHRHKIKTKANLFWPIKAKVNNQLSQSNCRKFKNISRAPSAGKRLLTGHNGFWFPSDWSRKWHEISRPITKRSEDKLKQWRNYFSQSFHT